MAESPFARRFHETPPALSSFGLDEEGLRWRMGAWQDPAEPPLWVNLPDAPTGTLEVMGRTFSFVRAAFPLALGSRFHLSLQLEQGDPLWVILEELTCWGDWGAEGWCFSPSALYDGNRFEALPGSYPPMFAQERPEDGPPLITEVPRLGLGGERRVEMLSGDMAVPAFGVQNPLRGQGALVFTDCRTWHGWTGMTVEEDWQRESLLLRVQSPGLRSSRYRMMDPNGESPDHPAWISVEEGLELSSTHLAFPADCPDDVYRVFGDHRNTQLMAGSLRCDLPLSEAFSILERKYRRDNWHEEKGFIGSETRDSKQALWQPGWVGGGISSLPFLALGSPDIKAMAEKTLDFLTGEGQAPSGLFHGIYSPRGWKEDGFEAPHAGRWVLVRKSADALYFLGRQIGWRLQQGESVPEAWTEGLERAALALARVWKENSSFGQFLDVDTGRIVVNGSTSGAMAPGALRLAADLLSSSDLAVVAEASGLALAERAVRDGFTTGGPGEALQCPDSESCAGLLESLVVLWERSGSRQFLDLASAMTRQLATWVVPYDFPFPEESLFGMLAMQTTGTVVANVQNRHSAPALCTHSPSALLRLWRAAGDPLALSLAKDIAQTNSQYLSRPDRLVGPLRDGWMCERVNMSDWELGGIGVGGVFDGSCWCEVSLLLTILDVPGLYLRPQDGQVIAFDHVLMGKPLPRADGWEVEVHNPTKFPARVRVWTDRNPSQPSPEWHGTGALSILDLAPGESVQVRY